MTSCQYVAIVYKCTTAVQGTSVENRDDPWKDVRRSDYTTDDTLGHVFVGSAAVLENKIFQSYLLLYTLLKIEYIYKGQYITAIPIEVRQFSTVNDLKIFQKYFKSLALERIPNMF